MQWLNVIKTFLFNNDLYIDKTTYVTVVIGQITIYGILMTFYQFLASYSRSDNGITQYWGIDLAQYYVKRDIKLFDRFTRTRIFIIIFIFEIIYKPFLLIFGKFIKPSIISLMCFLWFFFAVCYYIMMVCAFVRCVRSTFAMKWGLNKIVQHSLITELNKEIMKGLRTNKEDIPDIDLLIKNFEYLHNVIEGDNNPEAQKGYKALIEKLLSEYIKKKKNKIPIRNNNRRMQRKQTSNWMYDSNSEEKLIKRILNEEYFHLDSDYMAFILDFYFKTVHQNLRNAKMEGYSKVGSDKENKGEKVYNIKEWMQVTLDLYQRLSDNQRKEMIFEFLNAKETRNDLCNEYGGECVGDLMRNELNAIVEGKREQEDFVNIFTPILLQDEYNYLFSDLLIDILIEYPRLNMEMMIKLLNEKNSTYILAYIVMYYSVYTFRFSWEYFNIAVLKMLWERHCNEIINGEQVKKRINKSNIKHRFNEKMLDKFVEYINKFMSKELLELVYRDGVLDVFYIWIMKTCVIDQTGLMLGGFLDDVDVEVQVKIINELVKHEELLNNDNLTSRMWHMKKTCIPKKLNVTLRSLLLINIDAEEVVAYAKSGDYSNHVNKEVGAYLLVNLQKMSEEMRSDEYVKNLIRSDFEQANVSVDQYIDKIESECKICRCKLNYVQKKNMKAYLIRVSI